MPLMLLFADQVADSWQASKCVEDSSEELSSMMDVDIMGYLCTLPQPLQESALLKALDSGKAMLLKDYGGIPEMAESPERVERVYALPEEVMRALFDAADIVSTTYSLPPSQRHVGYFAPVLRHAREELLRVFGDAPAVASSPALTRRLLRLPRDAVLELLMSDELATDGEDTVLMLLSWWLEGERGASCDGESLRELRRFVRYGRLSDVYLDHALPAMPRLALSVEESLDMPGRPRSSSRGDYSGTGVCAELELSISEQRMKEHVGDVTANLGGGWIGCADSPSETVRGLTWTLTCRSRDVTSAFMHVGLEVHARVPTHESRLPLPLGIPGKMSIALEVPSSTGLPVPSTFSGGSVQDWQEFARSVASTATTPPIPTSDPWWWEPLLVDGRVRMRARVVMDDPPLRHRGGHVVTVGATVAAPSHIGSVAHSSTHDHH